MQPSRPLTIRESDAIRCILDTADFDGAAELLAQIPYARVIGGKATWLDLRVPETAAASVFREGRVPVRAIVGPSPDDAKGELVVWVKEGRLSAIEYAWYTEDEPAEFPAAGWVHAAPET